MNNNLNFLFGMYEPTTDSVIVNAGENSILVIRCKEYCVSVSVGKRLTAYIRQTCTERKWLAGLCGCDE